MKIAALQFDIQWQQPRANLNRLTAWLDAHAGADLYVLPEMFDTGFLPSEASDGHTLEWMQQQAALRGSALAGSISTRSEGDGGNRLLNRLYFVRPDGSFDYYDKRHLFGYGGEDEHYQAGKRRVVTAYRGVRFLLQVCYDLRFPVWSRTRGGDYDVILYVANWPASRIDAWNTLLKARAIENQCYVVGVNRTGNDPQCRYCGQSAIIGPKGDVLSKVADGEECCIEAEVDMDALAAFRRKFPVLDDADRAFVEDEE
ncbi:MAG: nitrilase family protein [Prevotella sp.]|nr:nitrilase family protein [Prevotella sp.]